MIKIYLASPLFSEPERDFNERFTSRLSRYFEVYLPQRDGALMVDLIASGWSVEKARRFVFDTDIEAIKRCDVLMAVVDGPLIDDGVAFEIGVAYTLGKSCVGFTSDFRREEHLFNNPMWRAALTHLFRDQGSLFSWADEYSRSALMVGSELSM